MAVNFVPWYHNYNSPWHMAVVEYIRTLPKNSAIAIEISATALENAGYTTYALNRVSEPNYAKPEIKRQILDLIEKTQPDVLSTYEILQECKKRNITVIPIESRTYYLAAKRAKNAGQYNPQREKAFITQINTILEKSGIKDLTVIAGSNHILNVYDTLRAQGTSCNIVSLFPEFRNTGEFIEFLKYIDACLEARRKGYNPLFDPLFESILEEKTIEDYSRKQRLVENAIAIGKVREDRTNRKLLESKKRLTTKTRPK